MSCGCDDGGVDVCKEGIVVVAGDEPSAEVVHRAVVVAVDWTVGVVIKFV